MKTIHEWIATLPEKQRKMAQSNMVTNPYVSGFTNVNSLKSALLRAFVWGCGQGTAQYWSDVYNDNHRQLF